MGVFMTMAEPFVHPKGAQDPQQAMMDVRFKHHRFTHTVGRGERKKCSACPSCAAKWYLSYRDHAPQSGMVDARPQELHEAPQSGTVDARALQMLEDLRSQRDQGHLTPAQFAEMAKRLFNL